MGYKNIAGRFFGLVRKYACDRLADGQNYDTHTALAQLRRAVKAISSARPCCCTDLDGGCDQHCRRPSEVYDTHLRTKLTALETMQFQGYDKLGISSPHLGGVWDNERPSLMVRWKAL